MNNYYLITYNEFQKRHRLNNSFFHMLKRRGMLPAIVRIGGRCFFLQQEINKWLKKNTHPCDSFSALRHERKSKNNKAPQNFINLINKKQNEARALYAPKLTDAEKEALEFNDVLNELTDTQLLFKKFCEVYPNKRVAKSSCKDMFEMFEKIDISLPALVVYKAEELAKKKKAKEIKFVPHPIVWLLSHDWIAELEKVSKQVTINK